MRKMDFKEKCVFETKDCFNILSSISNNVMINNLINDLINYNGVTNFFAIITIMLLKMRKVSMFIYL